MSITAALAKPMWIDEPDAERRIRALEQSGRSVVSRVIDDIRNNGFAIVRNGVPHANIDQYLEEFRTAVEEDSELLASLGSEIFPVKGYNTATPLLKILDTHAKLPSASEIVFNDITIEVLEEIFDEDPLAFQTLHFEVGSTQAVHQDTAYVVLSEPKKLIATWVALEDVIFGSGELIYYPKSHLMGEFLYPGDKKHWVPEEDGNPIHAHHLYWLHAKAAELGIIQERFSARKGDILFWHADLAHGGGEILNREATRRSLVTHYAPKSSDPHYFAGLSAERRSKKAFGVKGYYSSYFYP